MRTALRALLALAFLAFAALATGLVLSTTSTPATALTVPVAAPADKCDRTLARDAIRVRMTGVPLPAGWTMNVDCEGVEDGWVGQADLGRQVITRHLGAQNWPGDHVWNYLHEVAHAYDWEQLSSDERDAWIAVRGLTADRWYAETVEQSVDEWNMMPAEDWAESFATCHVGAPRWEWRLNETTPPSPAQCDLLLTMAGLAAPGAAPAGAV